MRSALPVIVIQRVFGCAALFCHYRPLLRSTGCHTSCVQDLVRSISGHREGHSQSQEQLLRTLEQRLGLRGPSGGHQGSSQLRSSSSGRSRSSNLERTGSAGSDQRLYRGSRSDGESAMPQACSFGPCHVSLIQRTSGSDAMHVL